MILPQYYDPDLDRWTIGLLVFGRVPFWFSFYIRRQICLGVEWGTETNRSGTRFWYAGLFIANVRFLVTRKI